MSEKIQEHLIDESKLPKYEEGSWVKLALEAVSTCPKIKKEREIKILADRFGLGKNPKTLQAIGQQYNLTRERIRQIVNNAIKKVKNNCIGKNLKRRITEIEKIAIAKKGIITKDFLVNHFRINNKNDINALVFVTNLSKKLTPLKESNSIKPAWVIGKPKKYNIAEITKKCIDILSKQNEAITPLELSKKISVEKNLIDSILETSKELIKTEEGAWGLKKWPHINPKSIKDKSRYILKKHARPMHYSDLAEKISQMGTKKVTKQSVHNELIKNKDFVLIGRGIYALSEWGYEPGVVEDVIISVLKEAGKPLHKNEIIKLVCDKRIVKESTIILNLQKSKFRRVSKGVYTIN